MPSEQVKSSRPSRDGPKKRSVTSAPISLEDLMEKEVQSSTQDGAIRELSVLADLTNKQSSKKKTLVVLEDSESDSSSSSEEENSTDEGEENSMTYDSESGGSDKSSNSATDTEEEA